jgi:hypothetical protein
MSRSRKHKPARPFTSLSDRRKWLGMKLGAMVEQDPGYYRPMLAPGEDGKQEYLKKFGGKCGCGKEGAPNDLEMFAVLLNVALPKGLDEKVLRHCDGCLPCFVWLGRMLHHYYAELGGAAWSEEVANTFPMLVRGWENDKFHFRVFINSVHNGPSFHVYRLPFAKDKKPLIIGSCAGVFGDGDYPEKEFVLATQKEMEGRAKETRDFTAALDPVLIVQVARKLGFDIDNEIYDFFGVGVKEGG